jgi:hypothetical protein
VILAFGVLFFLASLLRAGVGPVHVSPLVVDAFNQSCYVAIDFRHYSCCIPFPPSRLFTLIPSFHLPPVLVLPPCHRLRYSLGDALWSQTDQGDGTAAVRWICSCVGWRPRGRSSNSGRLRNALHNVETASGAHSASYPLGTVGSSLGLKRPGVKLTTQPQLVPRSRKRGSKRSSPIHPYDVVLG